MAYLTVKEFAGSITDFPIGAEKSQYEMADNFFLDEYKKLLSRPGRLLDFTTSLARAQVPTSASTRRISLMCPQKTGANADFTILKVTGQKIQYDNGSAMTELVGPASATAFAPATNIDAEVAYAYAEWNQHTILTNELLEQRPLKVYRDSGGTLRLRTAGLPIVANTFTATGGAGANYIYALVLKYTYTVGSVTYIDYSTPVFKSFTGIGTATASSSPGITVGSIPVLANSTGDHYDTSVIAVEIYRTTNNGTVLYKVGSITNGTTSYADTTSDNTLITGSTLYTTGGVVANDRPPKCKYVHGTSDFVYYGNGIEVSTTGADLEIQPQRVWQSKRGDPDSVPATFYADMDQAIVGISSVRSIPIVFCENSIYRLDGTFDNLGRGGIIPKKISDSVGAAGHLSLVQTLEGVFFAGTDGFYYTDGYQVLPLSDQFRISYADLVDSELKRKRICGCVDLNEQRVIWATWKNSDEAYDDDNAQVYVLDLRTKSFTTWSSGFNEDAEATLTATNSGTSITFADTTTIPTGAYIYRSEALYPSAKNNFVVSKTSTVVTASYNDPNARTGKTYKILNATPNGALYRNFLPSAMLFANRTLYMGDVHGFTTYFDKSQPSDVEIDPSGNTLPANFSTAPIYFNYKSPFFDFGTTEARKYVHSIITKARPRLDINAQMTLQITGENDDNGFSHDLVYIFFEQYYPWGTPAISYGDPRLYRTIRTIIDVKRRFPAGKLRCEYKQIGMVPAFVNIYYSSVYENANVASLSGNLYSVTLPTETFPTDILNYFISFESDDYTVNYRIYSINSSSVIYIQDPDGVITTGTGLKWVIRGLRKQALINLIEYSIVHEIIGPSQQPYQGENAVSQ